MSGFSFDATAGASQSTTKPRLVGNDIYKVTLESVEKEDYQSKTEVGKTFRVLKFRFANENGVFEHTVFEPTEKDFARTESDTRVGKIPQPSNVESMMLFFKHVIDSFNPKLAQQIDAKEKSLTAPNWDKLRDLICLALKDASNYTTNIKLLKDKNGEARFPGFFTGLTKAGTAYIKNNFIGDKLSFTSYEVGRIKAAANATPTPMSENLNTDLEEISSDTDDSNNDLNFDL